MYYNAYLQIKKQLGQLEKWLDAAAAHATAKSFNPDLYLTFRLAPDQFAFARQVQTTCDTAKLGASRLTGKDAPVHADDETTLAQLKARVSEVISYLDGFIEADFAGAADRKITQPRWAGKWMTGADYFLEHAQPNFFFHLTTIYAILRVSGMTIGKRDFLGALTQHQPE